MRGTSSARRVWVYRSSTSAGCAGSAVIASGTVVSAHWPSRTSLAGFVEMNTTTLLLMSTRMRWRSAAANRPCAARHWRGSGPSTEVAGQCSAHASVPAAGVLDGAWLVPVSAMRSDPGGGDAHRAGRLNRRGRRRCPRGRRPVGKHGPGLVDRHAHGDDAKGCTLGVQQHRSAHPYPVRLLAAVVLAPGSRPPAARTRRVVPAGSRSPVRSTEPRVARYRRIASARSASPFARLRIRTR